MAVFIILKNPKALINRISFAIFISLVLWSFSMIMITLPDTSKNDALFYTKIVLTSWIIVSSFGLWFLLVFSNINSILRSKFFYFFLFSTLALFIYVQWNNNSIITIEASNQGLGWKIVCTDSIWFLLGFIHSSLFIGSGFYFIFYRRKKTKDKIKRKQYAFIMYSGIVVFILSFFTDILLPKLHINSLPNLTNIFMLIWAVTILHVVVKYRLFVLSPITAAEEILSSMSDLLFLLNSKGKIKSVNKSVTEHLKYGENELVNQSLDVVLLKKEEFHELITDSVQNKELVFKAKNSKEIIASVSTSFIRDENERLQGIVVIGRDITDYIFAKELLKRSEERFRNIISNIPAAIYRCLNDENWTMIYISDMIEKISGYPASHFINNKIRSFSSIIVKEDNELITEKINEAIKKKTSFNIEYRIITKKGQIKWMSEQGSGVYSGNGNLLYLDGSIYDNTGKKLIEESLKKSEKKYRELIDKQGEGIGIVDDNEVFVFANPAAEEIFGVGQGELINKSIDQFTSPEEFNKIKNETQKRKKGVKSTYEVEINRPDGLKRTILLTGSPHMDENGIYKGTFGIFRDITQLKEVEKALQESEKRFKNLTEITDEGIIIHEEGKIIDVNPALLKLVNISEEEVKKKSIFDFVHPDYLKFVKQKYKEKFTGSYEVEIIKSDGTVIPVELTIKNFLMEDKNRRVISVRDITERKAYEEILRKSEQELYIANATKDKFFSIIAHDLKSPMGGFIQLCSFLNDKYDEFSEKELKGIIGQMHNLSHNTYDLLTNLLTWSRIQLKKIDLTPEKFNLIELVNKSTIILNEDFKRKEIQFTKNIDQSIYLYANRESIKMVIRNLLSNAIKFTYRNGTINISARIVKNQTDSNSFVEVCVMDSGVGISENHLNQLFKIDTSFSTKGTDGEMGNGLGLILCKEFVEKNGGSIWVESQKLKGSKFFFTIPLSKQV